MTISELKEQLRQRDLQLEKQAAQLERQAARIKKQAAQIKELERKVEGVQAAERGEQLQCFPAREKTAEETRSQEVNRQEAKGCKT